MKSVKIAIVCQRYGLEVNGGAEYHARILAEQLIKRYSVEILTSTALDYRGWANHYPEGEQFVHDIKVRRFKTELLSPKKTRKARRALLKKKKYFRPLRFLKLFNLFDRYFNISAIKEADITNWVAGQGPYCKDLIEYIKSNQQRFDVFIFFTYLYYPTVVGMPLVKEKSIFIPTAHDEPALYTKPYERLFSIPKFIMYNTLAEKELIEKNFNNPSSHNDIAGVGIASTATNLTNFEIPDLDINGDFFIYIGRIDENKGCRELINYFNRYAKGKSVKLLLVGKDYIGLGNFEKIIKTGFISEDAKIYLLRKSKALIMPSKYESLSMVTLEAMQEGKIVVVNGGCKVLMDHIKYSGVGFYYNNFEEFEKVLDKVLELDSKDVARIYQKSVAYVQENYAWDKVLNKFDKAIHIIMKGNQKL